MSSQVDLNSLINTVSNSYNFFSKFVVELNIFIKNILTILFLNTRLNISLKNKIQKVNNYLTLKNKAFVPLITELNDELESMIEESYDEKTGMYFGENICINERILETISNNEFKNISIIGSGGVGKSCLTCRLVNGHWSTEYDPTVIPEIRSFNYEDFKIDIVDTPGQEEFMSILDEVFHESTLILYCVDLTTKDTWDEYNTIISNMGIPIVIVGTKSDLTTESDFDDFFNSFDDIRKNTLLMMKISSKENVGIKELTLFMYYYKKLFSSNYFQSIAEIINKKKRKGCNII